MLTVEQFNQRGAGHLPGHLGMVVTRVSTSEIRAELAVKTTTLAPNGYLHAGCIVTLADTCAGYGCMVNLPEGATGFTTIELKSNHLGTTLEGSLECVATPAHLGRTTQVWDAVVTHRESGKTLALFRCTQMLLYPQAGPVKPAVRAPPNIRLRAMLDAPITPTLLRLAWPNLLMLLAQSSTGLIETWFLSKLGTDVLAGSALVIPVLMLMQNMSQGAMGGGISAAVARALGGGRDREANQLVLQAVVLNGCLGLAFSAALLAFGPHLYRAMGASGNALAAALAYSDVLAGGLVLMWVMNALASVVRGTGNMILPGMVICGGALLLVPLSPCLIFGAGPFPELGVAGAGWAMVATCAAGTLVLGWYCLSGRNPARLQKGRIQWPLMRSILVVGGLATLNPLLTNGLIAATTALIGAYAGTAALAGYGTAARLEYLVIPIAFGIGAPLVAMVGCNIGAGQLQRAVRIALTGGALAFVLAELLGLTAAVWPLAWMQLFSSDPQTLVVGSAYLRITGPVFGFFGLGFTLYFASQGAGRLKWPLLAGALRLVVAVGAGWLVLHASGSLHGLYLASAAAMFLYGVITLSAIAAGAWRSPQPATGLSNLKADIA